MRNVDETVTNLEDFSSTSSVVDGVETKESVSDFNKVVHDLTAIENLLKNKLTCAEQEHDKTDTE